MSSSSNDLRVVRVRSAASRAILALILREMATRYGRSPGGYIWAILEPLGAIVVLSFGFSLILRTPSLGDSFFLFFSTGFLPFSLYQTVSLHVSRSINFSKALLFFPTVSWTDAVLSRYILNTLTEILVMFLILSGYFLYAGTIPALNPAPALIAIVLAAILALGVGILNCAIIGLFPVWSNIWSIITRPLFLMSGVFYLYEDLPPLAQNVLWYNPLIHITGLMREAFYPTYSPFYINIVYTAFFGLICLFFGVVFMGRYHRKILNRD